MHAVETERAPHPRGEGDAWVPRETLSAAKEFHARMMPHSSFEPIVGFLRAMNKAWRRREMRHCERLRAAFQDRLDEVVRKIFESPTLLANTTPGAKERRNRTIGSARQSPRKSLVGTSRRRRTIG